jgi:hypothetical protein
MKSKILYRTAENKINIMNQKPQTEIISKEMNPVTLGSPIEVLSAVPSCQNTERILYAASAGLLFILILIGFQHFYFHGRAFSDRPLFTPIKG